MLLKLSISSILNNKYTYLRTALKIKNPAYYKDETLKPFTLNIIKVLVLA